MQYIVWYITLYLLLAHPVYYVKIFYQQMHLLFDIWNIKIYI